MGGGGRAGGVVEGDGVGGGGVRITRRFRQSFLREGGIETGISRYENIKPSGDHMPPRYDGDNLTRLGFQNVRGTDINRGFQVPTETTSLIDHGADLQGSAETNKPWTSKNKSQYDFMMNEALGLGTKTVYSSFPSDPRQQYQPGGTLMVARNPLAGRLHSTVSDKWGRFCCMNFQGRRDEGIAVYSGYRVCQNAPHNLGPNTSYTNQYVAMREEGVERPNPRKQFFLDLCKEVNVSREKGFRPIVMLDANGDWNHSTSPDEDFRKFLLDADLVDIYHERHGDSPRTYLWGQKRLDYILVDRGIVHAVRGVGYLGSHDGADSDHVYCFLDLDTKLLFCGLINRPIDHQSREFRLHQSDKCEDFLKDVIPLFKHHNIMGRAISLAGRFARWGKTPNNLRLYRSLYGEAIDLPRHSAAKIGKRKYGYMRNPDLTLRGRNYLVHKQA